MAKRPSRSLPGDPASVLTASTDPWPTSEGLPAWGPPWWRPVELKRTDKGSAPAPDKAAEQPSPASARNVSASEGSGLPGSPAATAALASPAPRVTDTTAPQLLETLPTQDATGVQTSSNIEFGFDEAILRGSGSIEIRAGSPTGSRLERFDAATSNRLTFSGNRLTIDPSKTLAANTRYFVILPAGSVRDAAGNNFAGTSSYSFSTVDTRAPSLTSASPADGASGVSVSSNIVFQFSEPIQLGVGLIQIRSGSSTGSLLESFDAGGSNNRLSVNGNQLTLDPAATLAGGTRYFVTIPAGAIRDLAGNSYGGTSSYDFTTVPVDTTPPVVSSFSPADGAVGVAFGSNLLFNFNEAIQRGGGSLELRRDSAAGSLVESFDAASSNALAIAGNSLTINPTADLASDSRYVLVVPAGSIKDLAGNSYAGTSSYDFTTIDTIGPLLNGLTPSDGATDVNPAGDIVLNFNETIRPGAGLIELRSGSATGPLVESFAAGTSPLLSWTGSQLRINPSNDLALSGTYVISLPAGSVLDAAGNAFAGLPASSFTTASVPVFNAATNPLYGLQWHLRNSGQGGGQVGVDVRAEQAWSQTSSAGLVLGRRTTIAIVDDGLQWAHPDLQGNYLAAASYDYNYNDSDPSPGNSDAHGTSCAGVAAAVGDNNVGVSGIAPRAKVSGIRLIAAGATDSTEGQALNHALNLNDIYSNSWGPADSGRGLDAIGPAARAALANGFSNGRNGKGALYFWAGGNGRQNNDNSNYDGYANSKYVIAVGAIADSGTAAYYSEKGANLLISAPSSGGATGIVTTDLMGSAGYGGLSDANYTNAFGGTSSATPLAAGVAALVLDANPDLTARDVMHILVQSARRVDATSQGWVANGAGLPFNHDYGFGMVDAGAAVALALNWTPVAPLAPVSTAAETVNLAIPDAGGGSLVRTLVIQDNLRIEAVEVLFNASHTYRGDLEVKLTSPTGSTSFLALQRSDSNDNYSSWTFSSRQHWNELSQGTWTLTVTDRAAVDVGTLHNWGLTITGTAAPASTTGTSSATTTLAATSPSPAATEPRLDAPLVRTDKPAAGNRPSNGPKQHWADLDPKLVAGNGPLHAYLASLGEAIDQGRAKLDGVTWTVATYADRAGGRSDPLTGLGVLQRVAAGASEKASFNGRGTVRHLIADSALADRNLWLSSLNAVLGDSVAYYYPNLPLQQTSRSAIPLFDDVAMQPQALWELGGDPMA